MVIASTAAVLIYFLILREENDWDEEIGSTIFEKVPSLHVMELEKKILDAKKQGFDTSELQHQLELVRRDMHK